jgi:hypothetical protein
MFVFDVLQIPMGALHVHPTVASRLRKCVLKAYGYLAFNAMVHLRRSDSSTWSMICVLLCTVVAVPVSGIVQLLQYLCPVWLACFRTGSVCQCFTFIPTNHQLDATISPVYYLTFIYSSTCFGRPNAHHQDSSQTSSLV